MDQMMHGAMVVDNARHRMHVDNHWECDVWTVEIDGHHAVICPTDSNCKYVYYRGYWFHIVIDELVTFNDDTQGKLDKRFDDTIVETLRNYIEENHIRFDKEGSDGNVHSTKTESETD